MVPQGVGETDQRQFAQHAGKQHHNEEYDTNHNLDAEEDARAAIRLCYIPSTTTQYNPIAAVAVRVESFRIR